MRTMAASILFLRASTTDCGSSWGSVLLEEEAVPVLGLPGVAVDEEDAEEVQEEGSTFTFILNCR